MHELFIKQRANNCKTKPGRNYENQEHPQNCYRNHQEEVKDIKREYGQNRHNNIAGENKQKLKEFVKSHIKKAISSKKH